MRTWFYLALLFACTTPARSAVWIVDAAGGGHFTDLPQAVSAAARGDRLLVRDGHYHGTRINRGLHLIAMSPTPSVRLTSPLLIANLAANERVFLRGIRFQSCNFGLTIHACAGAVIVEELHMDVLCAVFPQWSTATSTTANLNIIDCAEVILRNCTFVGSRASNALDFPALEIVRSAVWMYDVEVFGVWGIQCEGQLGGLGIRASQARILSSGGQILGGYGSMGGACYQLYPPCRHSDGGEAFDGPGTELYQFGTDIAGGLRGTWLTCIVLPPEVRASTWRSQPIVRVREDEALASLAGPALLPIGTTVEFAVAPPSANPQILCVGFLPGRAEWRELTGTFWLDPLHAFPIGATSGGPNPEKLLFPVENEPLAIGWEIFFQVIDLRGRLGAPTSGILYW